MKNEDKIKILLRVALVLLILAQTVQASDWPVYMHDAAHTGATDEVIIPPLGQLWEYKASGGIAGSPVVSGGILYLGSSDGSDSGYLYALDAKTGTQKWKFRAPAIDSSPAVYGDMVYVSSRDVDNGYVHAMDTKTGSQKWKYTTYGGGQTSPVISDGVVYVGAYALDANTGNLKWKYENQAGGGLLSSPAVSEGIVYVGSSDGNVSALDAKTGNLRWIYKAGEVAPWSSPAVSNGIVYVGSTDSYVYAIDAKTGNLKWKNKTGGSISFSPAVSGGTLYVTSDKLYAFDAGTGVLKWKYENEIFIASSPVVSGNIVYVLSETQPLYGGFLYALDANTGNLRWKYETNVGVSSPVISGGIVYVGSKTGQGTSYVYALSHPSSNQTTAPANSAEKAAGFEIVLAITSFSALYLFVWKRR